MSVRQRFVELKDREGWDAALKGVRHAFFHTWTACAAYHLSSGLPVHLYVFEDGPARVVCPVVERPWVGRVDVTTPVGFSGFAGNADRPGLLAHWTEFARARGYVCGYLGLNPFLENETYLDGEVVWRHHEVYSLDLTSSTEDLLASFDRNRRRQLRAFDSRRADFVHDHDLLVDFVVAEYPAFADRVGIAPWARWSEPALRLLCAEESAVLVGVGRPGAVEAAYLLVSASDIGESLLTLSLPGEHHHAAPLLWFGVLELQARGVTLLSLGGGVRPGDSVAQFKERFRAVTHPIGGIKQAYDAPAYEALCRARGVDPDDRRGYFPAYRAP